MISYSGWWSSTTTTTRSSTTRVRSSPSSRGWRKWSRTWIELQKWRIPDTLNNEIFNKLCKKWDFQSNYTKFWHFLEIIEILTFSTNFFFQFFWIFRNYQVFRKFQKNKQSFAIFKKFCKFRFLRFSRNFVNFDFWDFPEIIMYYNFSGYANLQLWTWSISNSSCSWKITIFIAASLDRNYILKKCAKLKIYIYLWHFNRNSFTTNANSIQISARILGITLILKFDKS